jgi:hypothetical protein
MLDQTNLSWTSKKKLQKKKDSSKSCLGFYQTIQQFQEKVSLEQNLTTQVF